MSKRSLEETRLVTDIIRDEIIAWGDEENESDLAIRIRTKLFEAGLRLPEKRKPLSDRGRARNEKALERIQDQLDDAESWLSKWSFGMSPSEIRKRRKRIEELTEARNKLRDELAED